MEKANMTQLNCLYSFLADQKNVKLEMGQWKRIIFPFR